MSDKDNPQPKIDPNLSDNTQKGVVPPKSEVKIDPSLGSTVQEQFQGIPSKPEVVVDDTLSSKVELSEK